MNDADRLSDAKCGEILRQVLLEIRALAWDGESGNAARIAELADIAHNLPLYLTGRDDGGATGVREQFVRYARRYRPQSDPSQTVFVRLLDMTADEFDREYLRPAGGWPAPLRPVAIAG